MLSMEPVADEILAKSIEYNQHKTVLHVCDTASGLNGFIAIHNDNIGSAVGGTRMYTYSSQEEALDDVLRLSRAMTYKCALSCVQHGGGKGVIIGDPNKDKSQALLNAYAKAVGELQGRLH